MRNKSLEKYEVGNLMILNKKNTYFFLWNLFLVCVLPIFVHSEDAYIKKIIFEFNSDEFYKHSSFDLDKDENIWFLDSDKGLLIELDRNQKKNLTFSVPTKNWKNFVFGKRRFTDDKFNFKLNFDYCGNFIIYTDAPDTRVVEFDSGGEKIKDDKFYMPKSKKVYFCNGAIFPKPEGELILQLSEKCLLKKKETLLNEFTLVRNTRNKIVSLKIPNNNNVLWFSKYNEGKYKEVENVIRDVAGNIYVTFYDYEKDMVDKSELGETYTITPQTLKFDKKFNLIYRFDGDFIKINPITQSVYSLIQNDNDKVELVKWSKN